MNLKTFSLDHLIHFSKGLIYLLPSPSRRDNSGFKKLQHDDLRMKRFDSRSRNDLTTHWLQSNLRRVVVGQSVREHLDNTNSRLFAILVSHHVFFDIIWFSCITCVYYAWLLLLQVKFIKNSDRSSVLS